MTTRHAESGPLRRYRTVIVIVALLAIVAALAIHATGLLTQPVYVTLKSDVCHELQHAINADGTPATAGTVLPCTFTSYLFRATGGWVTYGYSPNVLGQCGYVPAGVVESFRFAADTSARRMSTVPATCMAKFGALHPRSGAYASIFDLRAL